MRAMNVLLVLSVFSLAFAPVKLRAEDALVNDIPDFYHLVDSGYGEEGTVWVYACNGGNAEEASSAELLFLDADCRAVAEVSKSDLRALASGASHEVKRNPSHYFAQALAGKQEFSTTGDSAFSSLMSAAFSFIGALIINIALEDRPGRGTTFATAIVLLPAVFVFFKAGISAGIERGHARTVHKHLENGISFGVVRGKRGKRDRYHGEIVMQLFTDFVNRHGVEPVGRGPSLLSRR